MAPHADDSSQVFWEDGERVVHRGWRLDDNGKRRAVLTVLAAADTRASHDRLAHEYQLRDELDAAWALRPLELVSQAGRTMLVLEDAGGEPLDRRLGVPMEVGSFLSSAIAITEVVGKVHQRGLVHKDIKPANILMNPLTDEARLTGFGIASRLARERQSPDPLETIAGTLAYMAPEQTGRMNRSIDSRSDLYALGVTMYQMLTGSLPFAATDAMEWVHCHIARQPEAPGERVKNVPASISAIVLKLLAKRAEERYQTAAGLERDLRRCLADWEADGRIRDFPLGEYDTPDRLLIPEKLYGREKEIDALIAAFERIVEGGAAELVLVSGYSGIGKSSIVSELHKVLVPPRGLFASGKFDQYKRDIPYATLAQAFQGLIRPLLGKSEAELGGWREALREALGPNGQLIVDLVPELRLLIGEQTPVPNLSPQDTQRRFQLVFRRFLGVFARADRPLAVFLDDMQWLDAGTLDLLEHLLTQTDVRHLLLIGAYRDNEVTSAHPLLRKLEVIRNAGVSVHQIVLSPISHEDVGSLVAESLHCDRRAASPLAQLVYEKTAGNPFFAIHFLSVLVEEALVSFDHGTTRWSWDLTRIHAKGYTDNVVELMVGKLSRLPADTQVAMQHLACLGHGAGDALLAMVYQNSEEELHDDLEKAMRTGLVVHTDGAFTFVHDRVQEAAYSLIPASSRAEAHLRIGRLLAAHTPPEKREEAIFEIVNQLNRGANLITSADERAQLAELNLIAGKRAKASTAYTAALSYMVAGASLAEDGWVRFPAVMFALELQRAECEFLTGALADAETRLTMLAARAVTTTDQATVACLQLDLYTTLGRSDRAVDVGLSYLRHLGVEWSSRSTEEDARSEYERTWTLIGSRTIEELIDLPLMTDPVALSTLDVLAKLQPPALYGAAGDLNALTICRMVNLSLEYGNTDASCFAYTLFGSYIAGARFGDYQIGFRFGRLGCELIERRGLHRFKARTIMIFGNLISHWTQHVRAGRQLIVRASEVANAMGDLTFAAYGCSNLITNLLAAGEPLGDAQREAEAGLAFAESARFGFAIDRIAPQLGLIRTLRGATPLFGCLDDEQFNEHRFERQLSGLRMSVLPECWYWIRKLQARFLTGDYKSAIEASLNAQRLLWATPSFFETVEAHFYGALSHAASCDLTVPEKTGWHIQALTTHHEKLLEWEKSCPENFADRATLVGAEIARIEGRELDAEQLYEKAIRSARASGFVHNEGLANELAARFHTARGLETIANAYLRNARYCYLRWGADGKVRQLETLHPQLRTQAATTSSTGTIQATVEHLDLATVIKVSQTISGETVLEPLLDTLMRAAIEHAGAERALLILSRQGEPRIAAEATTRGDTVIVQLRDELAAPAALPESVLHYALRTREAVIIDDAASHAPFAADPYVHERRARSILALPLITQAKLIGALYLENHLAPGVFAPGRVVVLKLLASQAATALENARLYRDLAEREARIRRLVDADIIGIIFWNLDGQIIDANDAFLKMIGYDHHDISRGVLWTDLTPAEWRSADEQRLANLRVTGAAQPYEKELLKKDGDRVPVLIGGAILDGTREQGIAFVLDLTDRKRAEEAARESERRYQRVQADFSHATRLSVLGELTATIAHEVNQPLASITAGGEASLRWLARSPPEVAEVLELTKGVVADARRASEIIARVRAIATRREPVHTPLSLDGIIGEALQFLRHELDSRGVAVSHFPASSPYEVIADRTQLQQVIVNLVVNAGQAMLHAGSANRKISIRTVAHDPDSLRCSIEDSGPGIEPQNIIRLFDSFFTTKEGGMGMGLRICRSIIERHGGQIAADNTSSHGGARFFFTLPVAGTTA